MSTVDPSLSNRDLRPTGPEQRTWGFYNYMALWFSMCMEITTYRLASGLIANGMDWKQALGTVLLGNLIVLVPLLLNAHAGAKYGIPFPVFLRASFGVRGANLAALLRAVVACGWFGIQSWIGGSAIDAMLVVMLAVTGRRSRRFVGLLSWLLAAEHGRRLARRGIDPPSASLRRAVHVYHGRGAVDLGAREGGQLWRHAFDAEPVPLDAGISGVFFPSLTAMVGYWATLALNIPDFTRYSKSQSAQSWGQAFGLPVAMVLYTFLGIAVTSASSVLFGRPIWDPVELIGMFHQPLVAFVAMIAVLVATLNVNIGANVVSPSNDFSNLYPRLISFRTGGLITGFLGLAMCPWKLLATPDAYIFGWLVGYSGLLGPVAGIMVCDYFFIRGTVLDVNSLYHRDGIYHYTKGVNPRALIALGLGVAIALVGLIVPSLHFLYDYAWFVGFFTAGASYVAMMKTGFRDQVSGVRETVVGGQ